MEFYCCAGAGVGYVILKEKEGGGGCIMQIFIGARYTGGGGGALQISEAW